MSNLEALRNAMKTEIPASPDDFLRWHRKLMAGHPRMPAEAIGAFPTKQNWIGVTLRGPATRCSLLRDPKKSLV